MLKYSKILVFKSFAIIYLNEALFPTRVSITSRWVKFKYVWFAATHRVIRFWFLLNFLFISAFFDILALLSIPRVNIWGTFQSNYKHFSCQFSCLLLLLEVCKNYYRKENISVDGSKQGRDTRFWIHLKETWLNVFI